MLRESEPHSIESVRGRVQRGRSSVEDRPKVLEVRKMTAVTKSSALLPPPEHDRNRSDDVRDDNRNDGARVHLLQSG